MWYWLAVSLSAVGIGLVLGCIVGALMELVDGRGGP